MPVSVLPAIAKLSVGVKKPRFLGALYHNVKNKVNKKLYNLLFVGKYHSD